MSIHCPITNAVHSHAVLKLTNTAYYCLLVGALRLLTEAVSSVLTGTRYAWMSGICQITPSQTNSWLSLKMHAAPSRLNPVLRVPALWLAAWMSVLRRAFEISDPENDLAVKDKCVRVGTYNHVFLTNHCLVTVIMSCFIMSFQL